LNKIKRDELENKIANYQKKVTEIKLNDDLNLKEIKKTNTTMKSSKIQKDDIMM
jgi:hypothetical protein